MNANVEFDEIRPYHDEELPQVYEELIADAAFRQAVDTVMPGVPFEVWSQKMRACKPSWNFRRPSAMGFCGIGEGGYGWIDFGPYRVAGRQVGGVYLYLQSSRHYSRFRFLVHSFGRPGYGYGRDSHWRQPACLSVD